MKIFELKCKAYLKTNIELKSSFDVLSKYLNYSIYQNEIYKNKDTSEPLADYKKQPVI